MEKWRSGLVGKGKAETGKGKQEKTGPRISRITRIILFCIKETDKNKCAHIISHLPQSRSQALPGYACFLRNSCFKSRVQNLLSSFILWYSRVEKWLSWKKETGNGKLETGKICPRIAFLRKGYTEGKDSRFEKYKSHRVVFRDRKEILINLRTG